MGATLVAPVVIKDHLFWISVGDSPLDLFRDGELRQLNEDHSMAPQIDFMASSGLMNEEDAKSHPDRNCLTSVIIGSDIAQVDCPKEPLRLLDGDILVVASDGLQFLTNDNIKYLLEANTASRSDAIADVFLRALKELDDPDQDNISFSVIKVQYAKQPPPTTRRRAPQKPTSRPAPAPKKPAEEPVVGSTSSTETPLGFLRRRLVPKGRAS
jgi:serine/threonine protein phosphatase PrpC